MQSSKRKLSAGFSLIEVLVAITLLGVVVVPVCSSLVLSARMNAKTEALMQAQTAVSSATETLLAEGIRADDIGLVEDKYAVTVSASEEGSCYLVTVTSNVDQAVFIETHIRAADTSGEGGGT